MEKGEGTETEKERRYNSRRLGKLTSSEGKVPVRLSPSQSLSLSLLMLLTGVVVVVVVATYIMLSEWGMPNFDGIVPFICLFPANFLYKKKRFESSNALFSKGERREYNDTIAFSVAIS